MNRVLALRNIARARPSPSAKGQSERYYWEEILVQITLAFVIILGYLMTVSVTESGNMAAHAQLLEQRCQLMDRIVGDLGQTELGQARAEAVAAQVELQLQKLLRAWAELRGNLPLYKLLRQFDHAELIPLSSDLKCLPTSDGFQQLKREVGRVFLIDEQKVNSNEIETLMTLVLEQTGFNLQIGTLEPDAEILPDPAKELYYNKAIPTNDNLKTLKSRIVADLEVERQEVCRLQYALIDKISIARRDRLAAQPLAGNMEQEAETQFDDTDLGMRMLDQVLDDLKKEMQLLPEVTARIRQGVEHIRHNN
jgi:hypothetical protein